VVGEVGHRAALAIDDHDGGVAERRRVEYAVDVRQVVRDARAPAIGREAQHGGQFVIVGCRIARFLVRRKAFDHGVDRAPGPGQARAIGIAEVAQPPPVVLVARQALLLDRPQHPRALHQADAGVLGAVDTQDDRAGRAGADRGDHGLSSGLKVLQRSSQALERAGPD
jgi:hypothetical protein